MPDQSPVPADVPPQRASPNALSRLGWFILFWCVGVGALAIVGGVLKLILSLP